MNGDTCKCGSGLPFSRCHGNPSNEFARVQALKEAEGIAFFFPAVRLRGRAIIGFADDVASAHPVADDLPVEEGLALIEPAELRRLVDSWSLPYPIAGARSPPRPATSEQPSGASHSARSGRRLPSGSRLRASCSSP